MVVCGSGPRAVVTTASYEARKLAGIHSAMPAAVARRRLPDAVYLRPDFPAYREASAQVMEVLRRNAETVEVVGLDEAYLDLTGLFSPKATMRRVAAEIRERDRARPARSGSPRAGCWRRSPASWASRPGWSCSRARRRWSASPTSRPGWCPGSGRRRSLELERMGIRTLADLRRPRAAGAGSRLRAPLRRLAARPRPALGRDADHASHARPSRSRPRPPSTSTSRDRGRARAPPRRAGRGALPAPAQARARGAHDRDQGPPRRLDQRHPLAHRRGADQRPGRGRPGGARPAARLRPAAAGAAARRPRRLLRGSDADAEPEPQPEPQLAARPRLAKRLSGWPAPSRRRGSRAAP